MSIAAMNEFFTQAASRNIGYDQHTRWSFLNRATKKLVPNTAADCSSLCLGGMWACGYKVNIDGTAYTGVFVELAKAAGFTAISVSGWSSTKLYAAIRTGDFLLGPGHVLYILTPSKWVTADSDERGKAYGGQPGDQTGKEVYIRNPYMRSAGWTYIVRPPDSGAYSQNTMTANWTHKIGGWISALNVRSSPPDSAGKLGTILSSVGSGTKCNLLDVPAVMNPIDNAWWRKVLFDKNNLTGWVNVNYLEPIK